MLTAHENGFKIAISGMAKQIVLLTHGSWTEKDGKTTVPAGLYLDFYASHGTATLGYSVYSEVCKRPNEAAGGLIKSIGMSEDDFELLMQGKGLEKKRETREQMLRQATGVQESFGGGTPMFNYELSREKDKTRHAHDVDLFQSHADGKKDPSIDLIMMDKAQSRHLSDVFDILNDMQHKYDRLHFGACRSPG